MTPRGVRRGLARLQAAAVAAALLGSLTLVARRQARALEILADLDAVRHERNLAVGDRRALEQDVQLLESRGRLVPAAEGLGLRPPAASEIVMLERGSR